MVYFLVLGGLIDVLCALFAGRGCAGPPIFIATRRQHIMDPCYLIQAARVTVYGMDIMTVTSDCAVTNDCG